MFKAALPRPDAWPVFGMAHDHALYMMNKSAWDSKQYSGFYMLLSQRKQEGQGSRGGEIEKEENDN